MSADPSRRWAIRLSSGEVIEYDNRLQAESQVQWFSPDAEVVTAVLGPWEPAPAPADPPT